MKLFHVKPPGDGLPPSIRRKNTLVDLLASLPSTDGYPSDAAKGSDPEN
jgi:hypothetical protein